VTYSCTPLGNLTLLQASKAGWLAPFVGTRLHYFPCWAHVLQQHITDTLCIKWHIHSTAV